MQSPPNWLSYKAIISEKALRRPFLIIGGSLFPMTTALYAIAP